MKIRLIGSPDIVRGWARELERAYGIRAAEYPSRYAGSEIRIYADLDDRIAAQLVGVAEAHEAKDSAGHGIVARVPGSIAVRTRRDKTR